MWVLILVTRTTAKSNEFSQDNEIRTASIHHLKQTKIRCKIKQNILGWFCSDQKLNDLLVGRFHGYIEHFRILEVQPAVEYWGWSSVVTVVQTMETCTIHKDSRHRNYWIRWPIFLQNHNTRKLKQMTRTREPVA